MWEAGLNTQPKCDPRQHHGRINRRNAQDHSSLSVRPYSSPPPVPPATATPIATPSSVILPCPGHDATYVPCTRDHDHAGAAARPRHDEFCRTATLSTKCRECADEDAAASSAGDAHDGTLLCSQPTTLLCPQPAAARILLTSRGRQ